MTVELAEEASILRERLGFRGPGWIRAASLYLLLIGIFGVFLPWQRGRDFLDSVTLGAYACLGVVFAAPAAAAEFEKPTTGKALARVAVSVFYGELVAFTMLMVGIVTVYASNHFLLGRPIVVGPDLPSLARCAVFGLTLSLAVSTGAACLSLRFSPRVARSIVRFIFLGLLVGFYFRSGWLPTIALRGAGIALVVSVLFFLALRATLATDFGRREA